MGTSQKLGFYLTHGGLALVLPPLYNRYKSNPFTVTDATKKIKWFNHGSIIKLHYLNAVEKVKAGEFENPKPQKWRLTREACSIIKDNINGIKKEHKKRPRADPQYQQNETDVLYPRGESYDVPETR